MESLAEARIYKGTKSAMQSGRGETRFWYLEFEPRAGERPEPLMGWSGMGDTRRQVRLRFPSREAAESYAARAGISYRLFEPRERKRRPKSYAANFR